MCGGALSPKIPQNRLLPRHHSHQQRLLQRADCEPQECTGAGHFKVDTCTSVAHADSDVLSPFGARSCGIWCTRHVHVKREFGGFCGADVPIREHTRNWHEGLVLRTMGSLEEIAPNGRRQPCRSITVSYSCLSLCIWGREIGTPLEMDGGPYEWLFAGIFGAIEMTNKSWGQNERMQSNSIHDTSEDGLAKNKVAIVVVWWWWW